MRLLRELFLRRFLPLHLLIIDVIRVSSFKVPDMVEDKTLLVTSQRSQYIVREATTTTSSLEQNANVERKTTSPVVLKDHQRNVSSIFRPSVHLGEIEQPPTVTRVNPFNSVQHVKFDNNVQLDTRREQSVLDAYQDISSVLDEATRPSRIKFQNDDDQRIITEYTGTSYNDGNVKHMFVGQTFFQNVEKPKEEQDASTVFEKTMVDPQLMTSTLDTSQSPYVIGYLNSDDQNTYQPGSQMTTYEIMNQPENGVLVLQQEESTYTRKRKFPYQFYQPSSEYHEVKHVEVPQHSTVVYPQMRNMSPWKKIVRLIGTFLPLGLLLATLTPKVVRINNTTAQPSIVLSKLRAADLPLEHKRASRVLDDYKPATCEDRSICELILASSEPDSNALQNILWNLVIKISNDVAMKNGLREVFDAVRKKDCKMIIC